MQLLYRDFPGFLAIGSVIATFTLALPPVQAESIPVIDVHGILPDAISATPGAATSLGREDMEALRAYSLHDLLEAVPGLRTIDDDALGRRSAIGVRGAPPRRSRKTLLLEDGVPINLSAYIDPSAHYTPPMERLEAVDVLKGAGQILNGPLNNHGIVNFRNREPTSEPVTSFGVSMGSLSTIKRHISHSRTEGAVGMTLAYSGTNADGVFDVEHFQYDDFFARIDWQIDDRQQFGLSVTHHRERSDYDESNLTPQEYSLASDRKRGRFGQEYNSFALNYTKLMAVHGIDLGDRLSLATRFFVTDADRPRFTADPGNINVGALPSIEFVSGPGAFVPGEQGVMVSRDRHYRTRGMDSRMTLDSVSAGPFTHTWQWGLRLETHALNDMRATGTPGELLNVSNRGRGTRDVEYTAEAVSIFLQDLIEFGDWQITPGARAEYYTQSMVRLSIANDPGPHAPQVTDHNALLLPGISLLYAGHENTQWFANLARGYTPAPARTAASFPLKPETGINSQIGVRRSFSQPLTLEAALFYNRISNTIVQLPFSVDSMSLVLNSADSVARGVDLAVSLDSDTLTDSYFAVFAHLAYNYTAAEFTEDYQGVRIRGNRVPEVADHAGSLTLGFRHAAGWHASVTWSGSSGFFTDPMNSRGYTLTNSAGQPLRQDDVMSIREPYVIGRVPGHTLLSARVNYRVAGSGVTLWTQGRNLTDNSYVSDLENGIRPGVPRTLMLGVDLSFGGR